jgi:putative oxidoreductase
MKKATSEDLALLILRLALGSIMLAHGLQKVGLIPGGAGGIRQTIEWLGSMNVPEWMAWLSIVAELGGGAALLIGFFGRLAAFGVAVNMATAIYKVHYTKGFFNPDGIEFPLALFAMGAALLAAGMGAFSLDAMMARSMDKTIQGKSKPDAPPPS